MCYLTPTVLSLQQAIPNGCPAKALVPSQRLTIGLHALAGTETITGLADDYEVSRKFVYRQATTAQAALEDAFTASVAADDQVLFQLPVTKAWLRQATLGLTLIGHSSCRGVVEFFRDLLDVKLSLGTVHNIIADAVAKARPHNLSQDLSDVRIAGLDEIFQNRQPVLVGADIRSTYCFLLSPEQHRDADTWGVRLLELQDRGFVPQATIADFGTGLRAGQALALPDVPCRGDVFHALQELTPVVEFLENRAYEAIAACSRIEYRQAQKQRRQGRPDHALSRKLGHARPVEQQAITLAEEVALLVRWLREDVLAVAGPDAANRRVLYDFLVAELRARVPLCPHRLEPIGKLLSNHREELLAFAVSLDQDLARLAQEFQVAEPLVRELFNLHTRPACDPRRWQADAVLHRQLRERYYPLSQATRDLARSTVRASSIVENLNSRLRNYFFLRRHLGSDYLALLQFFLNHRRFMRSVRAERVGRSPAEVLTGQPHPHWLEMLGYTRFSRD